MTPLYKIFSIGLHEKMSHSEKQRTVAFSYLYLFVFVFTAIRFVYISAAPVVHYNNMIQWVNAVPVAVSVLFMLLQYYRKQNTAILLAFLLLPPMVVTASYFTGDHALQLMMLIVPVLIFFFLNRFIYILLSYLYVAAWYSLFFLFSESIFDLAINRSADRTLTILDFIGALFMLFFTLYAVKYQVWSYEKYVLKKNRELRTLNNAKDRIFAIVAHDLQAPLIGMDRLFQQIISKKSDTEEVMRLLPEMTGEISNTLGLLTNLLNWSKTQLTEIKAVPQQVNLHQLVEESIQQLNGMTYSKNIVIENKAQHQLNVLADAVMLNIILRNLCMNAIKFSKPGSEIIVYAFRKNHKAILGVKDNGTGMSNEIQTSLLQTFHHSTRGTANEQGFGLGLMICKNLTELNNGQLRFVSKEGVGSDFWIELSSIADASQSPKTCTEINEPVDLARVVNFT
jgi:two-component system sensor histidine kinase/response regulator